MVLDVLVQSRRDKRAATRLLRKLLKKQCRAPRVLITDKLASYSAARDEVAKRARSMSDLLTPPLGQDQGRDRLM